MENGLRWRFLAQGLLLQCWGEMTSVTEVEGVHGFRLREEMERPKQGAFSVQQRRRHNSGCRHEGVVGTGLWGPTWIESFFCKGHEV